MPSVFLLEPSELLFGLFKLKIVKVVHGLVDLDLELHVSDQDDLLLPGGATTVPLSQSETRYPRQYDYSYRFQSLY